MSVKRIEVENFTVFDSIDITFSNGLNIFIGENGTGKTHLLKIIYGCCEVNRNNDLDVSKLTKYFMPESSDLLAMFPTTITGQLKKLIRNENTSALIKLETDTFIYSYYLKNDGMMKILSKGKSYSENIKKAVFIPATEVLSHSKGFLQLYQDKEIAFDQTYYDIINDAQKVFDKKLSELSINIIKKLSNMIDGEVIIVSNEFYIKKNDGLLVPFSLEAEGFRKIAALWTLIRNGAIKENSILLWDEPESNINPKLIPVIVEILLELSRNNVQIFVCTHDYIFAKYFEIKQKENDDVIFHSLYKLKNEIKCESYENFRDLKNNPIINAFDTLMEDVINQDLGD